MLKMLKRVCSLFLFLLALAGAAYPGDFVVLPEAQKVIFWASYNGLGPTANQWYAVDVTQFGIPATATAVFLQGELLATGGSDVKVCTSYFFVRGTPSAYSTQGMWGPLPPDWFGIGQTHISLYGQGNRSPVSTFVPVVNGLFYWTWTRNTDGEWPTECSYGGNFNIQAYVQ